MTWQEQENRVLAEANPPFDVEIPAWKRQTCACKKASLDYTYQRDTGKKKTFVRGTFRIKIHFEARSFPENDNCENPVFGSVKALQTGKIQNQLPLFLKDFSGK